MGERVLIRHRNDVHAEGRGHRRRARITFDDVLIITAFRATMLKGENFTGDAVGPLQVLYEIICKSPNVARRFRERRTDVDWQPHLAADSEVVQC